MSAEGLAVTLSAILVLGIVAMSRMAPEQWLYDRFVDRHGIMEMTR